MKVAVKAPSLTMLASLLSCATAQEVTCEPWCSEPCTSLNGNVQIECGLGARHDGRTAGGKEVKCELQRVSRDELLSFSPAERTELLEYPTLITGLISEWPALRNWTSPALFSRRFGHHRLLAKRVAFGYQRAAAAGVEVDARSVSLAELVQRTREEHIIVLDEYGKSIDEDALLTDLLSEYSNPEVFESASQCRVFSFGGGHRGVQMMQHGVAWLGLISGAKLWHVAPPDVPRPSDRLCADGGKIDYALAAKESVTHCLLLPGETILVPENWWHATCNLDPYTIGVGGQLWRPGMQKMFETDDERSVPVVMQDSFDEATLVEAVPFDDVIEPIIFDPSAAVEEVPTRATVGATGAVS